MRIKEGFVLRQAADSNIVIAVGSAGENFRGMIKLNGSGVFLWNCLADGADENSLVASLCEKYGIGRGQATADVGAFLAQLREAGAVE